jgi:hypothetical protein
MKLKDTSAIIIAAILALPFAALADTSLSTTSTGDAFLDANKPTFNFGKAGTLVIAPSTSSVGEVDSVMRFNLATTINQFNTTYGNGGWDITGISLSLASQFGTNGASGGNSLLPTVKGGNFAIDWISYDGWLEGTGNGMGSGNTVTGAVSYNSIPTLLGLTVDSLGTFTYTPPGNNVYASYSLPFDSGLESSIDAGGDVSLYFYATNSSVGYLINSRDFGSNTPELTVTVGAVPEPATMALAVISLGGGLVLSRKFGRNK